MIEKHIVLEDIDPVIFYGVGNANLQIIRSLYPKLRIVARDNVIRVLGDEELTTAFEEGMENLRQHVLHFNSLKEEVFTPFCPCPTTRRLSPTPTVCS